MNENAYRARAERGEIQIGTWVTMIRTPAVLTLLKAAGLDFARIDMEHSPFDVKGLAAYMQGLAKGGPTKSGHRTPAVIVNVPVNGIDEATVRSLRPDLAAIARLDAVGVIVTAASTTPGVDFVSRYFAPAVGIDEDPVTGAAHCALAPFWTARLGRDRLVGYQASPRGGTVRCRVEGDRVVLGGRAVTVTRGRLAA